MSKDELNNKEVLEKEIDLIQGCINRMAQNSFMVKGWMITLVAVIIALLPEKVGIDIRVLCVIALGVTLCFWYLDAFYLKMEKLFRWKYEWVIKNRISTLEYAYDLNPHESKTWINHSKEPWVVEVMITRSIVPMYVLILIVEIVIFLIAHFGWFLPTVVGG